MSHLEENVQLQPFNTLGVACTARFFERVVSQKALIESLADCRVAALPKLVLGGGSNVVFREDFPGLVLLNQIKGIEVQAGKEEVWVTAGAGECWHDLVRFCASSGWGGVENLSLIPGTVGAAPVQNIGAYGVELSDVFQQLEAIHLESGEKRVFSREQCEFGYRDSFFKRAKGQFFIVSVTLRLSKKFRPNLEYQGLRQALEEKAQRTPSARQVSDLVCEIRAAKLPDPCEVPNVGSFFKNPVVSPAVLRRLQQAHPNVVCFPQPSGAAKIAAGWLIEQCGWKGRQVGNVGTYGKQALVIVNYGVAHGEEIIQFAELIRAEVTKSFGIALEIEPLLVPALESSR